MVSNVADKAKCAHRIYFIEPHQKSGWKRIFSRGDVGTGSGEKIPSDAKSNSGSEVTNFPNLPGVLRRQSIFLSLSKAASGATKNEQK